MPLKSVFDSQDDVPEEVKDYYEEADGKWVLAIDALEYHPKVRAVATANRENAKNRDHFKARVKELEEKLAAFPEDFDPIEYDSLKAAVAGKEMPKTDEAVAQLRKQLDAQHKTQLERKDAEIALLQEKVADKQKRLEKRTIDDDLTRSLVENGCNPKLMAAAKALLKESGAVRMVEEDDDVRAMVETEMGTVPAGDYVKTWLGGEGSAFVLAPVGGDAAGNNRGHARDPNPFSKPTWNKTHQSQMIRSDRAKAERLAKSAGFADINAAMGATAPIAQA